MTNSRAEDYRYGYQHIGIVSQQQVSIRKVSNCDGWIDLETKEIYKNDVVEIVKVNNDSIKTMKKPIVLSDKELVKVLEILRKEGDKKDKQLVKE